MPPEPSFFFQSLLAGILGGGSIAGIISYLGKVCVEHKFKKDLEKFKIELNEKSQLKLEELKSELNRKSQAIQKQKDMQTKAQQEIWPHINSVDMICGNFKRDINDDLIALEEALNNLEEYINLNTIHFQGKARILLDSLINKASLIPDDTHLYKDVKKIKQELSEILI